VLLDAQRLLERQAMLTIAAITQAFAVLCSRGGDAVAAGGIHALTQAPPGRARRSYNARIPISKHLYSSVSVMWFDFFGCGCEPRENKAIRKEIDEKII